MNKAGGSAFRCVEESEIEGRQLSVQGPDVWPSIGGSGTWTSVAGAVGPSVARVQITLASGTRRDAILRERTFVYFGRGDTASERPVRVQAFDASGAVVAAEPLR